MAFAISLYNNPTKINSDRIKQLQSCIIILDFIVFIASILLFFNNIMFYFNLLLAILFVILITIASYLLFREYNLCENVDPKRIDTQLRLNANVKAVLSVVITISTFSAVFIIGKNLYLLCLLPLVVLSFYLSYQRLVYCKLFSKGQVVKRFLFDNLFVIIAFVLCVIFAESNLLSDSEEIRVGFNIVIFIAGILLLIPTFLTNAKIIKKNAYLKNHLRE